VIASKRVMRQSVFSDEHSNHYSSLVSYILGGTALLVALIALALALYK
jgi:hypothetical protein